jgi:mannitol/fructose-specific phosphotransferase system IIA component (Ntr-type)
MANLRKMLSEDRVIDLNSRDKAGALDELIKVMGTADEIVDKEAFRKAILAREKLLSTGIGLGLAVPHAKVNGVKGIVMAVGRSKAGIHYDSIDGNPVHLVVMIGAGEEQRDTYIRLLAELIALLKDEKNRLRVTQAEGPKDIVGLLSGEQPRKAK